MRVRSPYRINLLPWRELEQVRRNRLLLAALAGAIAAAVVVVSTASWSFERRLAAQQQRNRLLEQETALLEGRIARLRGLREQREQLLARVAVIDKLQNDRSVIVRVFDELVNTLAGGMHYRLVEMRGRSLAVRGVAESNERISALMRNLDGSDWFASPKLKRVREDPGNHEYGAGASTFEMSFMQVHPEPADRPRAGGGR